MTQRSMNAYAQPPYVHVPDRGNKAEFGTRPDLKLVRSSEVGSILLLGIMVRSRTSIALKKLFPSAFPRKSAT